MAVSLPAIWSYAGVSMREEEGAWADTNRIRFLADRGWGYVTPLLGDGRTERNRADIARIVRDCHANGMAVAGWFTPRLDVPIVETVAMAHDCVQRYGIDAARYQTEAEFEYSNASMGGTPAERFQLMENLGRAHRNLMPSIPSAVYARVGLNLADAWWTRAWQYGFRCFVEQYGPSEYATHPGWAAVGAPGSASPPIVGGWWYRTRLGKKVYPGRVTDDARSVEVEGQGTFPIGSPAGPRQIAQFSSNKWGAVLGFFPTSWLKIVVPTYDGPGGRPTGATLAREILEWQSRVRRYGSKPLGYSVYVGPEMTTGHFDAISPRALPGTALLP